MSTGELAKALGISRQRINQLGRQGKITREPDGGWNQASVERELGRNLDHRQARPKAADYSEDVPSPDGPPKGTLLYEQWRLTQEKADRAALDNAVLEGSLLKRDEVKDAVAGMIASSRAKLLVIGDELADKLASTADPIRCRNLVDDRIALALASLAEYPKD
jgi:phage terminase Nu1 subunit (DNA packaging protein)